MDLTKENIVVLSHTVPIVRELPHCSGLMLFVSVCAARSCVVCSSVIFVVYSLHIWVSMMAFSCKTWSAHCTPSLWKALSSSPCYREGSTVLCCAAPLALLSLNVVQSQGWCQRGWYPKIEVLSCPPADQVPGGV